jgi:proteasome assembly chaperone (PAC2) family protein
VSDGREHGKHPDQPQVVRDEAVDLKKTDTLNSNAEEDFLVAVGEKQTPKKNGGFAVAVAFLEYDCS